MASEVIEAFTKLADSTEDKKDMINEVAKIAGDYRYVTPVRQRALELLKKLQSSSSSSSSDGK